MFTFRDCFESRKFFWNWKVKYSAVCCFWPLLKTKNNKSNKKQQHKQKQQTRLHTTEILLYDLLEGQSTKIKRWSVNMLHLDDT